MVAGSPRRVLAPLLAAAVSTAISLWRLWLADPASITSVMWAEDGLFPLCVRKAGFLACLVDPFAGYSLLVPRVFAGVTALFPIDSWPLVANITASVLGGVMAGWAVWWLRRAGMSLFVSISVALLPVLMPIVGFESISVVASIYMPMLFLAAIMVALPIAPYPVKSTAAFMIVTALTIPSVGLLLAVLVAQGLLRGLRWRTVGAVGVPILVGVVLQWLVSITAAKPRDITPGLDSLRAWADAVPSALLTFWPGMNLAETPVFTNYVSRPSPWTGVLLVGLLAVGGLWLVLRRSDVRRGIGFLILAGIALGAFPSVIGFSNNRYFVVPCLLWGAALLIALDPVVRRASPVLVAIATAVVLVIWWPAMPASAWRTTPAPDWQGEVERLVVHCKTDPGIKERFVFSPFWPPNWGDGLSEPSHPDVSCLDARRWG